MNKNVLFLVLALLGFCFNSRGQAPITGGPDVCVGTTITLGDASPGGIWTSGTTSVALIGSTTGVLSGVTVGTTVITYSVGVGSVTTTITVHPMPSAITGNTPVCDGGTIALADGTTGGAWSASPVTIATVDIIGVVHGVATGTAVISYTLGVCSALVTVTVNPLPAPITGGGSVCVGATITVADATTGGTWSSGNTAVATVGTSSGNVTGVAFGTSTITYLLSTGCYATTVVTVNVNPGPIGGPKTFCNNNTSTLTAGGTGAWTSSNTAVATVHVLTGVVSGVTVGTATITYTFTTGCYTTDSIRIVDCDNICPPNIDFEFGTLAYWNFFNGSVATGPIYSLFASAPVPGREDLMSGSGVDPYGGFNVVGDSTFSLKLGRDQNGYLAERARYFIHVPVGSTDYSLIYKYAVVFENPGGHSAAEQPRFEVNVYDSATGTPTPCAQYTYVSSSTLPGFLRSTVAPFPWYHSWATSSINLSGAGGTTVTVDFTAADCTLGGHWGYGYVDMTCGLFGINTVACNDTNVKLTAPSGFSTYSWYDSSTFFALAGNNADGDTAHANPSNNLCCYHPALYWFWLPGYLVYSCYTFRPEAA